MNIFLIEDDRAIREELARLLQKYGYTCTLPDGFAHAARQALDARPDLVLLDINLPCQDGFQLCRQIRQHSQVPILMLTARSTDFDELRGLELGADDFVTKPYNPQILLARIQKLLARAGGAGTGPVLAHNGLTLRVLQATMSHNGLEVPLTRTELGILQLLMQNKGSILPRDAIIDALWQDEAFIDENTLNVNIVRLRKKLRQIGLPDYLQTRRGLGYCV